MDTRYTAYPMAANATRSLGSGSQATPNVDVYGFLCTTAGSLRIGKNIDGSGADIVPAVVMTAGQFIRIPASFAEPAAVVLSGGAIGTLFAQ